MQVMRIKCDNPNCNVVGEPEFIQRGRHTPPYGWFFIHGGFMGCGPYIDQKSQLEVCSLDCLVPAIKHWAEEAEN